MRPHDISNIDQYLATCRTMAESHALYYNTLIKNGMPRRAAIKMVILFVTIQLEGVFHGAFNQSD